MGKERPSLPGKPPARAAGSGDESWEETHAWPPLLGPGVHGGCVGLERSHTRRFNIFPARLPNPETSERDPGLPGGHGIMFTRGPPFIKDVQDELKARQLRFHGRGDRGINVLGNEISTDA